MTFKATGPSNERTLVGIPGGRERYRVTSLPLERVEIQVRYVNASADPFNVIVEARFTTFRTANVA